MPFPATLEASTAGSEVVVLAARRSQAMDGIFDYTSRLADALRRREAVVEIRDPRKDLAPSFLRTVREDRGAVPVTIVVQYNPFSFARWGFAPWLPFNLWRAKREVPELRLALMLHEPYVPIRDWRTALMSLWQRAQLRAVRALCDTVFMSVTGWRSYMPGWPRRPTHHLPVGSNLPDRREQRARMRERLGADEHTVVLAAFGSGNPARLMDYVAAAADAVAEQGFRTLLLNLGADTPSVAASPKVEIVAPGPLAAEEVAAYLAAADLYLAPLIDGISTRRATVMAALQHGLPVLGTAGSLTDAMLARPGNGIVLVPVGDPVRFGEAASSLAADGARRDALADEAGRFYEEEFAWEVAARHLLEVLRADGQTATVT